MLPPGPTGKTRADGVRTKFLRGATAVQELIEPMITGEPYRIAGLVAYGTSPLQNMPRVERTKEALRLLDLFVVIDVLPSDHVAWADVVLPEATYLERYDDPVNVAHKTPYLAIREPAIPPMYDTRPGWWIARELGRRLGLEAYFPWKDAEEYLGTRLLSVGSSLAKVRAAGGVITFPNEPYLAAYEAKGTSPFGTASGKIELRSAALAKEGHDPLPRYEPTREPPEGMFRLLYGRAPMHTFSRTQNTPVVADLRAENEVWVNADAAKRLGLATGDRVVVENEDHFRSGPIRVRATQRIRPDAVFMVHGFGHRAPGLRTADRRGASDSALQSRYRLDPISGGAGLHVNFVRLILVERAA